MKLEEYEQILRTGTPSDRARAIAAASDDKEVSDEEFHQLTALIKGAVRPSARKMTPDEAKLWAEVSRVNTRLKQEMVAASFTVRALAGRPAGGRHQHPLQDRERDAGRPDPPDGGDGGTVIDQKQCIHVFEITRPGCLACAGRDEKCREYKGYEEKQDEPHDRA